MNQLDRHLGVAVVEQRRDVADIGDIALHARNVAFDFSSSPLQWIPGESVASHSLSALNFLLPAGEQVFVDVFSRALPHIKDEKLREAVVGFIGQEQIHSDTHDHALLEFFGQHGIDVRPLRDLTDRALATFKQQMNQLPPKVQYRVMVEGVAIIAGIEHLTATAGDWLLNHDFEKFGADPVITDMFRWHGAEEVEHRSVAWDLARHLGVGRVRMMAYFIGSCATIPVGLVFLSWLLARADPALPKMGMVRWIFETNRAMKRGSALSWSVMGEGFRSFLRPGFTPESIGDSAQAVAYLAKSPAAKAATAV
ncbi:metal-dependent hydrolase [Mycobacterium sp. CBMA271]|uniref:metal-dependent hydrolase n=1 Tax=unclassified Mycobacteroides TaxID=2618759 RepID=UPI0012DEA090|nr:MULTISPECIES: metal-dependent hydrolase [unclassified Mycobacteroides]MUM19783.1 metal-dependent hydrolase [Mycobacteroides sp. CBMA 326]MUM21060.1 metal-dependent hydrolase [Mycobacteroides sp. CBMA 271]